MASWNSENLRVWKVWLNGIKKIEELNSIIFKAWKVWLYGIQKIEEFNSMVFTTWKLWFYGIQKIEEFKSMVFKAWRGQNLLMGTLVGGSPTPGVIGLTKSKTELGYWLVFMFHAVI